ncbi:MAG: YdcH family protein [Pseudomonadota bacterium]
MLHQKKFQNAKTLRVWKEALQRKHADLDAQIHEESAHPLPDFGRVKSLKRSKLKLKDEMALIDGVLRTIGQGSPLEAA